jgi:hypothetical protein
MALRLSYQMFSKLLGWKALRVRSETAKEIEILVLRHQLAVVAARNSAHSCCGNAVGGSPAAPPIRDGRALLGRAAGRSPFCVHLDHP